MKIFTIGHSNKTREELFEKLKENNIAVLVDVRSIPYSKWQPQFNRENLIMALKTTNISYTFRGKNLGGLGVNTDWSKSIQELILLSKNFNVCVMCSEADPEKCHRSYAIAPELVKKGVEVIHISWYNEKVKEETKQEAMF